ncbi:HNH endonuclease [Promicromonospora sp. NPDC059942]|uniref:HNH endonuclease signature motif containing protein n=1 Tax=Promicromonospora sp. NPDC059942 TaxID=3347009 RepID=UPI00366565AC
MDEIVGSGAGPVAAVEWSLEQALGRALSAEPGTGSRTRIYVTSPCMSWTALPLDGGRTASEVVVTWTGHGGATRRTTRDPVDESTGQNDLCDLPVGAGLVAVLTAVEVADTDDADLLDVAARWQDVISWATAMQSRATGEIARRRGWTTEHTTATAEISARLHIPQGDANKLMARGTGLTDHPQVMNALHNATIDTTKADILLRAGNPLTIEERDHAITLYLPQAPDHTRRWLRDKMNQHATHLHGTTEVAKHATTRRSVYLDPADNSMAWISANLPATDAAAVWDTIEQAAHTLRRTPGNTRTLTQARADALVAITTGRIIVPPQPECTPDGTVPPGTGTTTGRDTAPGEQGMPRTTAPATGCTCGGCLCGGTNVRVVTTKPQLKVTVPATTLLGLDDTPGHLHGYGPIPAETAARIATDATWQRLITDPVTGVLTDYSTTTYQPGKILRQAVTQRDETCCFPQCDRPARWADLDHINPYDHALDPTQQPPGTPGQTRATNLQPLCRAHHLAKTHGGWNVTRDPDTGNTTWTAPTGHTHTRPPTQIGHVSNDHAGSGTATATDIDTDTDTDTDITSLAEDIRQRLGRQGPDRSAGTPSDAGPHTTPDSVEQCRPVPGDPPF